MALRPVWAAIVAAAQRLLPAADLSAVPEVRTLGDLDLAIGALREAILPLTSPKIAVGVSDQGRLTVEQALPESTTQRYLELIPLHTLLYKSSKSGSASHGNMAGINVQKSERDADHLAKLLSTPQEIRRQAQQTAQAVRREFERLGDPHAADVEQRLLAMGEWLVRQAELHGTASAVLTILPSDQVAGTIAEEQSHAKEQAFARLLGRPFRWQDGVEVSTKAGQGVAQLIQERFRSGGGAGMTVGDATTEAPLVGIGISEYAGLLARLQARQLGWVDLLHYMTGSVSEPYRLALGFFALQGPATWDDATPLVHDVAYQQASQSFFSDGERQTIVDAHLGVPTPTIATDPRTARYGTLVETLTDGTEIRRADGVAFAFLVEQGLRDVVPVLAQRHGSSEETVLAETAQMGRAKSLGAPLTIAVAPAGHIIGAIAGQPGSDPAHPDTFYGTFWAVGPAQTGGGTGSAMRAALLRQLKAQGKYQFFSGHTRVKPWGQEDDPSAKPIFEQQGWTKLAPDGSATRAWFETINDFYRGSHGEPVAAHYWGIRLSAIPDAAIAPRGVPPVTPAAGLEEDNPVATPQNVSTPKNGLVENPVAQRPPFRPAVRGDEAPAQPPPPIEREQVLAGMEEAFRGWREQQPAAPTLAEQVRHVRDLWTGTVRAWGPAAPSLAEVFMRILPQGTAHLAGTVESVREELGAYGWQAALQDPASRLVVTTAGQVVLVGGQAVSYDCAAGALALKQRLLAEGYQNVGIAVGRATDGIYEVFATVGAGLEEGVHKVTAVPGRAPVDDPALIIEHLLSPDEERQLAAGRQLGAVLGGPDTKVRPMAVVPSPQGGQLLFAGVSVEDTTVTLRIQARALHGEPAVRQLEMTVPRAYWRNLQALAGELTPLERLVRLQASPLLTIHDLPEELMPHAVAILTAMIQKLDLTPRQLVLPPTDWQVGPGSDTFLTRPTVGSSLPGVTAPEPPAPWRSAAPGGRSLSLTDTEVRVVEPTRPRAAPDTLVAGRGPPSVGSPQRVADAVRAVGASWRPTDAVTAPGFFLMEGKAVPWMLVVAKAAPVGAVVNTTREAEALQTLLAAAGLEDRAAVVAIEQAGSREAAIAVVADRFAGMTVWRVPVTGIVTEIQRFLRRHGLMLETAGAVAAAVQKIRDYLGSQL